MAATLKPRGNLTDRETIWTVIRSQSQPWTLADIAIRSKCEHGKVRDYVRSLVRAGIVAVQTPFQRHTPTHFILAEDRGVDAPRVRKDGSPLPPTGRARMWKAMRILKVFTETELAEHASLPEAPVAEGEVHTYCLWLARGGYLRSGGERDRWSFIPGRYTGAKAPQVLRIKQLYDPNTGEVVYQSKTEGGDE